MDFKQFVKNKNSETNTAKPTDTDDLKKTFDEAVKFTQNMSESQLMNEIIMRASKERKNGNLSDESLENFYKSVSPMLNNEQINKLKEILGLIK